MCRSKGDPENSQHIGVVAGRACFCVGVFFIFMLLFNGVAMYASATRLEYGRTRDFWVSVLRPLERISRASGLFLLRDQTEKTPGNWLNKTSER